MIRTIKSKITWWKLMAIMTAFPAFFFLVSCQDQIVDDATHIAQNSTMALDYPQQVQDKLDELKKLNPEHKFVVLEPDEKATDLAGSLEKKIKEFDPTYISSMHVMKDLADSKGVVRSFIVIDYDEHAKALAGRSVLEGEIFTVVEESATMPGGLEALGTFLQQNLRYPKEAREQGKEGNIFVQFVVNKDGSISDLEVTKGVDERLDKEALRVVGMLPKWNPGKQNGSVVRQRFVLPVAFRLANSESRETPPAENGADPAVVVVGFGGKPALTPVDDNMRVTSSVRTNSNGKKRIEGAIYDSSNNPLPGANIVVKGRTIGTTTDIHGNFSIEVPVDSGELAVSFVGFKTETIAF